MKFFSYWLLVLAGTISAFAEGEREQPPVDTASETIRPIVLVGPEELARLKKNAASKKPPFSTAWDKLLADANKALTTEYPPYTGSNSVEFRARGVAAAAAVLRGQVVRRHRMHLLPMRGHAHDA